MNFSLYTTSLTLKPIPHSLLANQNKMSILSRNYQGINNPTTIQHLKGIISLHKPDILFLSETLANERHMSGLAQTLQYQTFPQYPKLEDEAVYALCGKTTSTFVF